MNVFKIHRGFREIGPNYGLPVWYVDCGPGVNYEPSKLLEKMGNMGLNVEMWVVIRKGLKEQGTGQLVKGLKFCKCRVEIEDSVLQKSPGWFTEVDRFVLWWSEPCVFPLQSLRPRQDMLVHDGSNLKGFLETKTMAYKGLVIGNKQELFESIKDWEVRVYARV